MPAALSPPAAGYAIDETTGRLYEHTGHGVTVMFPWSGLMAFSRPTGDANWSACLPEAPLLAKRGESDAVQRFCERIPHDVPRLVAPFANRHWHLLRWLARSGPAAEDLCANNPALAYMVASGWEFGWERERRTHEPPPVMLPYRKQRDILDWLGFPPTEALRHIIRKILPSAVAMPRLVALRRNVRRPEVVKKLCHVPRINADVLQLAGDLGIRHVAPAALAEIAELPDDPSVDAARTLADTFRMWRRLRPREAPPEFHTVQRLQEVHDELVREVNIVGLGSVWGELPDSPVIGTKAIVPLTTRAMLLEEGRRQHNCVASYADRVESGRLALYRVIEPERATLSLVKRGGRWHMDELKGPCNAPVKPTTREAVRAWLVDRGRLDPDEGMPRRRRTCPAQPHAGLMLPGLGG